MKNKTVGVIGGNSFGTIATSKEAMLEYEKALINCGENVVIKESGPFPNHTDIRSLVNYKNKEAERLTKLLQEDYTVMHRQLAKRKGIPFTRTGDEKIHRNTQCPCGSGKKYKNCCI